MDASNDVQEKSECVAIFLEPEEDKIDSSTDTPFLHSRFLCPSNLGALLESTTVSLVVRGWKEASAHREERTDQNSVMGVVPQDEMLKGYEEHCSSEK